jgi:hypothetical protein
VAVGRFWTPTALATVAVVAATVSGPPSMAVRRAPANDDRADARVLTGSRGGLSQTTVRATSQARLGEQPDQATVWFRWRANHTGWETFDTAGSQAETGLNVYPPGSFASGYVFWSRLFGPQDSDIHALTPYPGRYAVRYERVIKGRTYYVQLWTQVAGANTVHLAWRPTGPPHRPANDDLADARVLVGPRGSVAGTTEQATYEPGESPLLDECASGCGYFTGDHGSGVWFRWTPPSDGTWRLDNATRGEDSWIQVYRGGPTIGRLSLVKEGIGYPGSYPSTLLDVPLKGGTTYWIRYSSYTYHGPFILDWEPATGAPTPARPANDDFAAARDLGSSPTGRVHATNQWATVEPGEPETPNWTDVHSTVWFRWTAPSTGLATVGTPDYYTATRIWTGSTLGSLQWVSPTYWGEPDRRPTFQAQAGTTYWIQMGGPFSHGADFDLTWDLSAPANDNVTDAYPLPADPDGISPEWRLVGATAEPGEPPDQNGRIDAHTIWTQWTPSHSGAVSFETVGDHVPALQVFTAGPSFDSMTRVAGGPHGADFEAQASVTYWIQLRAEVASIGHIGWHQRWDRTKPAAGASLNHSAPRTRETWVSLRLNGSDTGSGVSGWLVSMMSSSGEILSPAWVPARGRATRTVRWSVTHTAYGGTRTDGTKRVYVQAVDAQGNHSRIISRSIVLKR